jgi:hypothetical protein
LKCSGACSTSWGEERCITSFGVETEGKRPLGRPRHRWDNNIKKDFQEVVWRAWTGLMWLRIVTDCGLSKYGNEASGSIKFGEFLD